MQTHNIRDTTAAIAKDGRLVYARGFTWGEPDVEPIAAHRPVQDRQHRQGHHLGRHPPAHRERPAGLRNAGGVDARPRTAAWSSRSTRGSTEVTVDHLLTHTSGMYSEDNIYEVSDVVADAARRRPTTDQR